MSLSFYIHLWPAMQTPSKDFPHGGPMSFSAPTSGDFLLVEDFSSDHRVGVPPPMCTPSWSLTGSLSILISPVCPLCNSFEDLKAFDKICLSSNSC